LKQGVQPVIAVELVSWSRVAVAESLGQFTNLEEGEHPLLEYWKLQELHKMLRKKSNLKITGKFVSGSFVF
jgi:hypothetical protein